LAAAVEGHLRLQVLQEQCWGMAARVMLPVLVPLLMLVWWLLEGRSCLMMRQRHGRYNAQTGSWFHWYHALHH
jgi:hypothetical protein